MKRLLLSLCVFFVIMGSISYSQDTAWTRIYSGPNENVIAHKVVQTFDGGFILCGYADFGDGFEEEVYLIRTNSYGDTIWTQSYGDSWFNVSFDILQNPDSGYTICGASGTDVLWDENIYLIRANKYGETIWTKKYGDSDRYDERGYSICTAIDTGFIICGFKYDTDSGDKDVLVLKVDVDGDSLWANTYGGTDADMAYSIISLNDGYLLTGYSRSFAGIEEIYLLKIDIYGNLLWQRNYGQTSGGRRGYSAVNTSDGGFAILGSGSVGDIGGPLLLKTDSLGDSLWTSIFDGHSVAGSLTKTYDGGLMISSITQESYLALISVNNYGDSLWSSIYDHFQVGYLYDIRSCIIETYNHGYVSSGTALPHPYYTYMMKIKGNEPIVGAIEIGSNGCNGNVIDHYPVISWEFISEDFLIQHEYELEVGLDNIWDIAELWQTGIQSGSETFISYSGQALSDDETYYLRLRVNDGESWSEWYETAFHMNSKPSIPMPLNPIYDFVSGEDQPKLWVQNSTDAEIDDTLTYEFIVTNDTVFGEPEPIWKDSIIEDTDSTGWQVTEPLNENWHYFWSARAFDQYEYSNWSEAQTFWVNAIEEAPGDFDILYPPNTDNSIITNMLAHFSWNESMEQDPLDSIHYTLYISLDSSFDFVKVIDSIWATEYTLTTEDSLDFGTKYWWKVKATDNTWLSTYSDNSPGFRTWMLGDASVDWQVNILDVTFLINYLYKDGTSPYPIIMGDIDGSCSINILDVTYLINYLYKSGPAPQIGCN